MIRKLINFCSLMFFKSNNNIDEPKLQYINYFYRIFKNYGYKDDKIIIAINDEDFTESISKIELCQQDTTKFIVLLYINSRTNNTIDIILQNIEFYSIYNTADINNIKYIIYFTTPSTISRYVNNILTFKNITYSPINKFVIHRRLSNHRTCKICNEKRYSFKVCFRCSLKYCSYCFYNTTKEILICPFCRYTFHEHINLRVNILNKLFND